MVLTKAIEKGFFYGSGTDYRNHERFTRYNIQLAFRLKGEPIKVKFVSLSMSCLFGMGVVKLT